MMTKRQKKKKKKISNSKKPKEPLYKKIGIFVVVIGVIITSLINLLLKDIDLDEPYIEIKWIFPSVSQFLKIEKIENIPVITKTMPGITEKIYENEDNNAIVASILIRNIGAIHAEKTRIFFKRTLHDLSEEEYIVNLKTLLNSSEYILIPVYITYGFLEDINLNNLSKNEILDNIMDYPKYSPLCIRYINPNYKKNIFNLFKYRKEKILESSENLTTYEIESPNLDKYRFKGQ